MAYMKPSDANATTLIDTQGGTEKQACISVTLKAPTEVVRADSGDLTSPKKQAKKVVSITPIIGRRSQAGGWKYLKKALKRSRYSISQAQRRLTRAQNPLSRSQISLSQNQLSRTQNRVSRAKNRLSRATKSTLSVTQLLSNSYARQQEVRPRQQKLRTLSNSYEYLNICCKDSATSATKFTRGLNLMNTSTFVVRVLPFQHPHCHEVEISRIPHICDERFRHNIPSKGVWRHARCYYHIDMPRTKTQDCREPMHKI